MTSEVTTPTNKRSHQKMVNQVAMEREQAFLYIDDTHKILPMGVAASVKYFPQYLVIDKKGHNWKFYYRVDNKVSYKTIGDARAYVLAHM